jgi:hypothetical protein
VHVAKMQSLAGCAEQLSSRVDPSRIPFAPCV